MYRTYYRAMTPRTRKPRQQPADVVVSADVVWGAAAYADRVNGGEYRKEPEYRVLEDGTITQDVVRHANRFHMWKAMEDTDLITDADVAVGRESRDWLRKTLVFRRLKGSLSDFDQALAGMVDMDEFMTGADRYEIAIVTSQIRAWREGTRMEQVMADVDTAPVAPVGEKVQLNVEVVKSVYSANYNVYFITAKTDGHQMVFFSYRERIQTGSRIMIRGSVKAHRQDATQLNRVKVL
jgi:hypothetical protein